MMKLNLVVSGFAICYRLVRFLVRMDQGKDAHAIWLSTLSKIRRPRINLHLSALIIEIGLIILYFHTSYVAAQNLRLFEHPEFKNFSETLTRKPLPGEDEVASSWDLIVKEIDDKNDDDDSD
jgi:hypothetical protein